MGYENHNRGEGETLSMTTVTEMLGGGQVLLGISYDVQVLFEERLSDDQRLLLAILRLVEEESGLVEVRKGRGPDTL